MKNVEAIWSIYVRYKVFVIGLIEHLPYIFRSTIFKFKFLLLAADLLLLFVTLMIVLTTLYVIRYWIIRNNHKKIINYYNILEEKKIGLFSHLMGFLLRGIGIFILFIVILCIEIKQLIPQIFICNEFASEIDVYSVNGGVREIKLSIIFILIVLLLILILESYRNYLLVNRNIRLGRKVIYNYGVLIWPIVILIIFINLVILFLYNKGLIGRIQGTQLAAILLTILADVFVIPVITQFIPSFLNDIYTHIKSIFSRMKIKKRR